MIISPDDSPTRSTQEIREAARLGALDGHCWYPAVQRCGCGLNLRSAMLWTDHIADLATSQRAAAALS